MTGSGRHRGAAMVAPAVASGVLVLVWAATSGPVAVFSPSGRIRAVEVPSGTPSVPDSTIGGPTLSEVTRDVEQTLDLSWLGDLIAWALLLLLALAVLLGLRFAVRHGWRRPTAPLELDVEALPEERLAAALGDDASARSEALRTGSPRNGIVGCWARLEDVVAAAGVPSSRHETSSELTVRVLHELDLDPQAVGELARLYREARFSEHDLPEAAREAARAALARIQTDLAETRRRT